MLIIFDLDDTLIDTSGSYLPFKLHLALKAMVDAGLKVDSEKEAFDKLMRLTHSANGKSTIKKFLQQTQWDENIFNVGVDAYYNKAEGGKVDPLPNTLNVLQELSQEHNLILLSYGSEKEQYHKMQLAKINVNWFKKIIIADQYNKFPYYQQLLKEFSINPNQVLVIGDKYDGDLLPAKQLGITIVHFMHGRGNINPPSLESVDYQIDNILKVKEIIKELK